MAQRRTVRTDSAIQPRRFSIARVRSRWCAHTVSTQLGCRWHGLSRVFTVVLMLQSLVHCTAAAVRPELAPFSGSGAGELEDPTPTQPSTVSTSTTASPPGGNRGIMIRECVCVCVCAYLRKYAYRLVCVTLASMKRIAQEMFCLSMHQCKYLGWKLERES